MSRSIYKIKHKLINKSFSADNVRIADDFYLVSCLNSFSVIARRDEGSRLVHGDNLCELIDVRDRSELKKFMYNDSGLPLVLRTDIGTAIINKHLLPSTLLLSVSFICDEEDTDVSDLILQKRADSVILPEYYTPSEKAIKHQRELINRVDNVLYNYKASIQDAYIPIDRAPRITVEKLYNTIEGISRFCGTSVDVTMHAELICQDIFDLAAFKSFLLAMLMLARQEALCRGADVEVTCMGRDVAVTVSFDAFNRDRTKHPEIEYFFDFADRNNMHFENLSKDGRICVRFCPSRRDWNLIDLRAYIDFDWDS